MDAHVHQTNIFPRNLYFLTVPNRVNSLSIRMGRSPRLIICSLEYLDSGSYRRQGPV